MAGYSGTPLIKKLGIKAGMSVAVDRPPANYQELLGRLPSEVQIARILGKSHDFIHSFAKFEKDLDKRFPLLKKALNESGMLWISWPKGKSKIETDLNDHLVREIGLKNGLVDVKVCAVDQDWSGLKFVYRLRDRRS